MDIHYQNFSIDIGYGLGNEKKVLCQSTMTHNLRIRNLMMGIELTSISNPSTETKKIVLYIKEGTQEWTNASSFLIYQAKPSYTENLLLYLTNQSEMTLALNTKIALSVVATDSGLLAVSDKLYIWGQGELFISN